MKIIINWIIQALAILVSAYILPGVNLEGVLPALVLAVVLGGINAFLKPVLIVLTLPLNIFTLGLLTFVINAFLIQLSAVIVPGFDVNNFWWALLFSIVLSLVNMVFGMFKKD